MAQCPKCQGQMQQGRAYADVWGWRVPMRWVAGRPSKSMWVGLSFDGAARSDVTAMACTSCGYIENYLGDGAGANQVGMQLRAENDRLKSDMTRLLDRVATLERIATDPAERTAREIEDLRKTSQPD